MSIVKVQGNATGTGIFTIAAPSGNTDRTLTLPDATGTVQVSGNPISGTTGTFTGLVDLSAAGAGQIQFPATQNASANANTLDDYEEGTWTPTLLLGGSSTGISYAGRGGTYTKIGNTVRLAYNLTLSNKGSNSGYATISGLPFTPTEAGQGARNIGIASFEGSLSSFPTSCAWNLAYSDGLIYIRYQTSSGYTDIFGSQLTNSTIFFGTVVYLTA